MKKQLFTLLITGILFISCTNTHKGATANSGDTAFQKLSDDFLSGYLKWRPQASVALGFHEYDGKITDFSKASIDSELARLNNYGNLLSNFDTTSLSPKMYYDFRILRMGILDEIFNIKNIGGYTKNPMTYAGAIDVNIYIKRNFAPLNERIKSIIAIEKQAPAVYAAAKANLADSLAKPYIETAIEVAKGSAEFLNGDLVVALKDVKDTALMAEFNAANKKAVEEVKSYADYLEKEKLPKAHNHYAIGVDNYKKMLLYVEGVTLSPEKVLELGMQELKKQQDVFNTTAKIIDPKKSPVEVYHDMQKEHPAAEDLIPDAKKHLEAIRQFLVEKKLITMPSEVRVKVEETPEYARASSTASMDTPGPFETKATEAYYYITPVDQKWTEKQKEDWLSQFDYYTTDNVTIHEAYPGHYTQFLHLNASSATKIEKIFGSYAFIEGWAHYCEQMMADAGYGHNTDSITAAKYRLAQTGDALLRVCRLCVSIKTHCQGMTIDEATKFFMDNWYQGDKPSRQEALRGSFDPGYLFYTIGKLEILKLREDYKKQEGSAFSLQKFHDQMLDNGMPPIFLLREVLLKDKSIWGQTL